MKSDLLIHPELLRTLAELGHTDLLLVCDAGYPIPPHVPRIDLAYRPGQAPFLDVLDIIVATIHIEQAVIATEAGPELGAAIDRTLRLEAKRIAHADLKARSRECRAAVRTGEYTAFANVLLSTGVAF